MDVFPSLKSNRLSPITHPGKWDVFENLMTQLRIIAFISFIDLPTKRIFAHPVDKWIDNHLYVENFKRVVRDSKKVNYFDPNQVNWTNVSTKLQSNPTLPKKTSNQRMNFKLYGNIFLTKKYFTFGFRVVPDEIGHVYQTTEDPLLIYDLTDIALKCEPSPSMVRRSFVKQDEGVYDRYVLRPNYQYVVPPGSRYVVLTVQKTLFGVEIMDWKEVCHLQDFKSHKSYKLKIYNLPPPTPAHDFEKSCKMIRSEDRRRRRAKKARWPPVFVKPVEMPFAEPQQISYAEPQQMLPVEMPFSEPVEMPFSEPQQMPFSEPQQMPFSEPQQIPFAEPVMMPISDPQQIPFAEPVMIPISESVEMPISEPVVVPISEPVEMPISDPPYMCFQDPIPMIFENDVPQVIINNILKNFMSSRGPAHRIRLDGPNFHNPHIQSYILPPPPDNYWGPCPVVDEENTMKDVEDCQEMAEDLTTERTSGPRKQHVFQTFEPMNLTV